ncbi:uncharacterized protein LOC132049596 isoform X1 [Lycium ferocissimum]|uniref:uncharacterized protein LOC132049596 isoform X1 n=1 Tax=Lycium ferocissimum TaxID=112874 RepID=UPI0028150DF5|nr:uncharacterized protein LOC132049596 isoform X1 [Lycium ferocissimum]
MCNCFSLTFFPHSSTRFFFAFKLTHKTLPFHAINRIQFVKPKRNLPKSSSSNGYNFFDDQETKIPSPIKGIDDDSGIGFLEFDNKMGKELEKEIPVISPPRIEKQEDITSDDNGVGFLEFNNNKGREKEMLEKGIVRRKKQMMKRSNMIAKQVISIQSALSLGFVSQLWVDINSWMVFSVEVRPNLLSGEVEQFLLENVKQVGDVVLVEDESVMENEIKLVGLQTLVGYNVVTPRQRNIGKVRGYTFNISSGAVESLELDCLGISIIPSSLVSTYCLFVEDVVDVLSDTIVVHEAAASRLQRLTKGFWDAQKMTYSADEMQDYRNLRNTRAKPEYSRSRKKSSAKKLRKKIKELADDWELPMDFF